MRILLRHEISNRTELVQTPAGKNPIRIGSHVDCDVRLTAGAVPAEAARIVNQGRGRGWELHTTCNLLQFQEQPLPSGHALPLAADTVLYLYPFWLTVSLDQDDQHIGLKARVKKLDEQYFRLVQVLHQQLLEQVLHTGGQIDTVGMEAVSEPFLFSLEQAIEQTAVGLEQFPADDLHPSPLADHMAGLYCRSRALAALAVGQAGGHRHTGKWSRLRTAQPDHDRQFEKLLSKVMTLLKLDAAQAGPDLTQNIRQLDEQFWPLWTSRVNQLPLELRRYLALAQVKKDLKDNWFGLGPLEDLLEDPTVTEIMVNDANHIFIEKFGSVEETGQRFLKDLREVIDRIVGPLDRTINTSTPLVDARLPDGSRVNAIISPIVVGGPTLTIRRFPKQPIDWTFLLQQGSITSAAMEFLRAAVTYRANILVAGGTASGKTTLLGALSLFIQDRERIVTIEDTAELRMQNRHVVRLEARPKNLEGSGEIPIRALVKNALRMRPDRIIIGECRGGEALDMLQAMNTGHDGSMTTVHANSPRDVVSRLEVMVQQGEGSQLPVGAIHRQIASAIDLVVQLIAEPLPGGKRRRVVKEIAELVGIDDEGQMELRPIFRRSERGELRPTGRLPTFIAALVDPAGPGFNLEHLKKW
jgi:pilus assembly protein CpaF